MHGHIFNLEHIHHHIEWPTINDKYNLSHVMGKPVFESLQPGNILYKSACSAIEAT